MDFFWLVSNAGLFSEDSARGKSVDSEVYYTFICIFIMEKYHENIITKKNSKEIYTSQVLKTICVRYKTKIFPVKVVVLGWGN